MWPNLQFPADLVRFTEEIFNGKLYFLCSVLLVESDKIIAKIDFEIQSHIKECHPNNYHHEYEFLERKNTIIIKRNYQKEKIRNERNTRRRKPEKTRS